MGVLDDSVGSNIAEEKPSESNIATRGWIVSDDRRSDGGMRQAGLE